MILLYTNATNATVSRDVYSVHKIANILPLVVRCLLRLDLTNHVPSPPLQYNAEKACLVRIITCMMYATVYITHAFLILQPGILGMRQELLCNSRYINYLRYRSIAYRKQQNK